MNEIIEKTKRWVQEFVIKLNLCPFAAAPFLQNKIRFVVSEGQSEEEILAELLFEIQLLETLHHETTLIIIPDLLQEFEEYLGLFDLAEHLLQLQHKDQDYQLASFHPDYMFADSEFDDPANATNRSPYPMLHILRCMDVEKAIDQYPDTLSIPQRNVELLRKMAEKK